MRRFLAFLALSTFAFALAACESDTATSPTALENEFSVVDNSGNPTADLMGQVTRYRVTLENLTPNTGDGGSQVFSPPVLATHQPGITMFQMGRKASAGMAAIAEDAMNAMMVNRFSSSALVRDTLEGGGVIFPGGSDSWEVSGMPREGRLSLVCMLVNTNDGFTGVNSIRLPSNDEATYYLKALDAGSELNTELATDIPGPCCGSPGMGTDTSEPIHAHSGIRGTGDLDPAKWGWHGPVAKLTITRIN